MPTPDKARMRQASAVLAYEYGTFQDGAVLAMMRVIQGAQNNVAVEAMATHLRILIQFFYEKLTKSTEQYVLAEQFFEKPETEWRPHRGRDDKLSWHGREEVTVNQVTDMCNYSCAHLSWRRLEQKKPTWDVRSLLIHFDAVMHQFMSRAPKDLLDLSRAGTLALPETAAGLSVLVTRYQSPRYVPQLTVLPG